MGRATRWLKGLFGIKKNRDETEPSNSGDRRDKNGSFGHYGRDSTGLCHNPATIPPNITPAEASWLRSFYSESDDEQSKHAIAVATATAAAADAAIAAAKAAVAVVRLSSQGRDTAFGRGGERWAAVKIQTIFRGYLSRKALRALKGLVKIQALVRGYLVRKEAAATLHSMQALIRAQATVRAEKARLSFNRYGGGGGGGGSGGSDCFHPQFRCRKSIENFGETRSEKHTTSIHSRRLSSSSSFETLITNPIDETTKIVEVDTGTSRPKSRSRRTNTWVSDSGDSSGGHSLSYYQTPATRLSIPTSRNPQNFDRDLAGDKCRCCCTAQSTPRFANSCKSHAPVTPARNVCVDNFFRQYANFPNYMASTQSFKAKLRSQSAPKQRPETGHKKKLSLSEMMESRSSVSGIKMQSSCSQVHEVINFKNVVMGNFNRSSDFY